jgi:hypothetical protein
MVKIHSFQIHPKFSFLLVALAFTLLPKAHASDDEAYRNALAIFERRIVPILNSSNPSSCAECHLSGVDLKNYIAQSPDKTFISLRDEGLIDLKQPSASKILDLIRMSQPESNRLTEEARQSELAAFTAFIEAGCKSEKLVNAKPLSEKERATPHVPVEVIRHARKDRVLDSFVTNVWSQIQRCAGCHGGQTENSKKLIKEHGQQVRWSFETPKQTLETIIEREYIDTRSPEMSLLVMKPTMQVEHGGGKKMEIGDRGYKQFREFIADYAAVVDGYYESQHQLPEPSEVEFIGSQIWLKVAPTPEAWADKLLGVVIFPFDESAGEFSTTPIAESDRRVWGKGKLWQHSLILRAASGSQQAVQFRTSPRLPQGRYLIKFFLDAEDELREDWETELTDMKFFVGEVEVRTDWPVGYQKRLIVHPPQS